MNLIILCKLGRRKKLPPPAVGTALSHSFTCTYWLNCTTQSLLRQPCVFLRVSVCVCTCVYVCTLLKAKLCCPPCYRVITCISCKEKSNFSATGGAAVILATRKKFIKSFDIQIPCCTLHMASTLQRLPSIKSL